MANSNKAKAALVACVSAILVSGCGTLSGSLLGSPSGATETISLQSGIQLDLFVPEGWYLKLMEEDEANSAWKDPVYLLVEREFLPESEFDIAADDPEVEAEMFAGGHVLVVRFEPYQPCVKAAEKGDSIREYVAETEDANASTVRGGVGEDGFIATIPGSGWRVTYYSSLPAANSNCQVLEISGAPPEGDPPRLADFLTVVAENSVLG